MHKSISCLLGIIFGAACGAAHFIALPHSVIAGMAILFIVIIIDLINDQFNKE